MDHNLCSLLKLHKCRLNKCIRTRFKTHKALTEIRMEDTRITTTVKTSSREHQRRTLFTNMKRKRVKMASKEREAKRLNLRKNTSPNKRRMTKARLKSPKHQSRPRPQSKLLKWLLLNEHDTRS